MYRGIEIVLSKPGIDKELGDSVFLTGFTGLGLVGYLASRHIAYTLGLERIGFVKTRLMPEITFYKKEVGVIYPFELYYGEKSGVKLLVLVSHSVPNTRERTYFVEAITRWVKKNGVREAVLIGGLDPAVKDEDEKYSYRWIPINGTDRTLPARLLEEKHVVGLLALTMMFFEAYGIPGVTIFPYAEPYRPDPRATAVAVKVVSELLGIDISVESLYEEAKRIESLESLKDEVLRRLIEVEEKGRKTSSLYI